MTTINRGTLLELVRNRPLLAAELLGDALAAGDEEPIDRGAFLRRFPRLELTGRDESTLAARYREIVADARRARAHQAQVVSEGLIAFLRARIAESLDQGHGAVDTGEPDAHKAERDLTAKRDRVRFLESVLVNELYLAIEEHAQAEHLLRLEASAYDWHDDYQDLWQP
ncbi:hypothetical protein [Microbispora sp. ATCC PTA-5024]|uniref:hypothetical protein n=1 Tax=Microbispora sp. ATCC PTA-5024 TaxID=316330 RepID=UPI0003DB76D1|nr:hypothetical protein [Microbispora sp. ATCC PTA-5024]ETK36577.1 hypothetical protein MPTA5024_07850 [Microbispora sp. ATCC PTA-5024]